MGGNLVQEAPKNCPKSYGYPVAKTTLMRIFERGFNANIIILLDRYWCGRYPATFRLSPFRLADVPPKYR